MLAQQTKFVVPSGSNLLNILGLDDRGTGLFPQAPPAPRGGSPAPPRKFPGSS